jgi:Protein of unknown function (DUF1493)
MMFIKFTLKQRKNMQESLKNNSSHQEHDEPLLRELMNFVAGKTGYDVNKIKMDTKINFDVRIDGDDADEFMQNFAREFKVNLSDFEFNKYFSNEGADPIVSFFIFIFKRKRRLLLPLYIRDLYNSILAGHWVMG